MGDAATALRDAALALGAVSDTARLDAELLLAHAFDMDRGELLLRQRDLAVPDGFADLVERRLTGEPVAYITGVTEFYGLPLCVTPDVLIPRGDSELMIDVAQDHFAPDAPLRVLDLGTGSGALLLAALAQFPAASGLGMDQSVEAVAVARDNAERLGLSSRADMRTADWTKGDWLAELGGPFDLILANPPYIAPDDGDLANDVRTFEPAAALFAGRDGLDAYRIIIPAIPALLRPGGVALVEIGWRQKADVSALARASGLFLEAHRDLAGRDRLLALQYEN